MCDNWKRVICVSGHMALLCVLAVVNGAEHDKPVKELALPKKQLIDLAEFVCFDLFYGDETLASTCRKKFLSSERNMATHSPKMQVRCRSEKSVTFKLTPSTNTQLVILVPTKDMTDSEYINYSLLDPPELTGTIPVSPKYNYTLWTSVLNKDGSPTFWHPGPIILANTSTQLEQKVYEIKSTIPYHDYMKDSKMINGLFTWDRFDDYDACFEVINQCNTKDLGDLFHKRIGPDNDNKIVVDSLPLNDNCTLTVRGRFGVTEYVYHTPTCRELVGCVPLPETPKDVILFASEAAEGSGWDLIVSWSKPKFLPDRYNVTLRANVISTTLLPGNATEVTFHNVEGEGLYNVSVLAITTSGWKHTSRRGIFPQRAVLWWAWGAGSLLSAAAALTICLWWQRRRAKRLRHLYFQELEEKFTKDYVIDTGGENSIVMEDSWEVRPERLLLHEVIGEGAFGVVRRGTLAPGGKEVAVKMLKDMPSVEEIRSFRAEMELMKSVGAHPHVVSLVGCCSGRRPLIVAEYCSRGDLLTYLRRSWNVMVSKRNVKYDNNNTETMDYRNDLFKSKPQKENFKLVVNKLYDLEGVCDADLTLVDLLSFCRQIAMGMEFLSSNRVVHRDLAARNILVTGDRTLKIADFGLSRDVYQNNQYKQKGNGKMPVKWMALESLTHRIYTTKSDVWSFGVVMWEIVTVGGTPYSEVPAARLPRLLRAGYRMPKPNNCTKQLYEVMLSCWRASARDRPTFAELHQELDTLLHDACAGQYLALELDNDAPPTPRAPRKYIAILARGKRAWTRGESYERPLNATQSNHYTSPPDSQSRTQIV